MDVVAARAVEERLDNLVWHVSIRQGLFLSLRSLYHHQTQIHVLNVPGGMAKFTITQIYKYGMKEFL
jgi:hypothetical protein